MRASVDWARVSSCDNAELSVYGVDADVTAVHYQEWRLALETHDGCLLFPQQ
jgi:hypothetical protein